VAKRYVYKKRAGYFVPAANNRLPEKNSLLSFIYVFYIAVSLFLQLMKPYRSKKKNIVNMIITEK
jgi:hypothetical protein